MATALMVLTIVSLGSSFQSTTAQMSATNNVIIGIDVTMRCCNSDCKKDNIQLLPFGVNTRNKSHGFSADVISAMVINKLKPITELYLVITREELLYQLSQEKSVKNKRGHGGIYVKVNTKYDKYLCNPKHTNNENENKDEEDKNTEIIDIIDKYFTMKEAYLYFSHTHKFDLELIAMASQMLYAKECAGNITCGGTESIFLAMKCWRTYGEKVNGIGGHGIPNVILPITSHPAISKACNYLQIEVRYIDIYTSPSNLYGTVNLNKLEKAIDKNTIYIVGNAPCFPYSVVDNMMSLATLDDAIFNLKLPCLKRKQHMVIHNQITSTTTIIHHINI